MFCLKTNKLDLREIKIIVTLPKLRFKILFLKMMKLSETIDKLLSCTCVYNLIDKGSKGICDH